MTGKCPRAANVNVLNENFSVFKLDGYLQLVDTERYEKMNIHPQQANS
jgi:hypothetical protein